MQLMCFEEAHAVLDEHEKQIQKCMYQFKIVEHLFLLPNIYHFFSVLLKKQLSPLLKFPLYIHLKKTYLVGIIVFCFCLFTLDKYQVRALLVQLQLHSVGFLRLYFDQKGEESQRPVGV